MNKHKIHCWIVGHDWHYIDRYLYSDVQRCRNCMIVRKVENSTPGIGSDDHWNAFCTIHWFATGRKIVRFTPDETTHDMYNWWLGLQEDENGN